MSRRIFKSKSTRRIISVILVIILALGAIMLCVNCFGAKDKKEIGSTAFSVGGLDEQGNYLEQKNTIFTEELIPCKGLEISRDFTSKVSYVVYLYDQDKELLEKTDILTGTYKLNNAAALYCRIMILPEEYQEKDFEIKFYQVKKYAKDLTITVDKNQSFDSKDYFVADEENKNKVASGSTGVLTYVDASGYGVSELISTEGIDAFNIKYTGNVQPDEITVLFFTASEDGSTYSYVSSVTVPGTETVTTVEVAEGATHIVVNYRLGESFEINQGN